MAISKQELSYRVGRRIRVPEVRVIGPQGEQMGVMTVERALLVAESSGLDLVEVSPKAFPPVCRIMDYGKFKYELAKKDRSAKKHRSTVQVKEVKFRPKTDAHDMDFKLRHVRRFLSEGNKARLVVTFRGRELAHPDLGRALLQRVAAEVSDAASIEQSPMMEGKRMMLVLAPKVGIVRAAAGGASPPVPSAPGPAGPRAVRGPGGPGGTARPGGPTVVPGGPGGTARPGGAPPRQQLDADKENDRAKDENA